MTGKPLEELRQRIQREVNMCRVLLGDQALTQEFRNQLSYRVIILTEVLSWIDELEQGG